MRDERFMQRALELASRGQFTTMPNPSVGCVIVRGDEIVGEGWHERAGQDHAEVLALREAGERAAGATAYVTLEPCNATGRTGPCTRQLVKAGIARVVAAVEDPNPSVNGAGIVELKAAGIEVDTGPCMAGAMRLNRGFFSRMRTGRPFVHAKMAASIDGRTAMSSGESQWITGTPARLEVQKMRASSCAMVTGVDTVIADNPRMDVRADELGVDIGRQPALVIVDSALRTPAMAKVVTQSVATGRKIIVACAEGADSSKKAVLEQAGVEVKTLPAAGSASRVNLPALLDYLGSCEYNEVLLESGATLFGAFISAGLVDELSLFIAPRLFGQTAKPLAALDIAEMRDARGFTIEDARPVGEDFLLRLAPRAHAVAAAGEA